MDLAARGLLDSRFPRGNSSTLDDSALPLADFIHKAASRCSLDICFLIVISIDQTKFISHQLSDRLRNAFEGLQQDVHELAYQSLSLSFRFSDRVNRTSGITADRILKFVIST